ncbi:MAG: hypothetical protein JW772_04145, partial [Candidatus Diapherotrites archaeon]|nr:hypothetical protein [Candidatus Diapherotrites archaeon]
EWTMASKPVRKKWVLTREGKMQKNALRAAFRIVREFRDHAWLKANPETAELCGKFIRNKSFRTGENARAILRALNNIERKPKDAKGQQFFDFGE